MHFLQIALHLLQVDLQTSARRKRDSIQTSEPCDACFASTPHGKPPVVFAALILGTSFAPAYAQQFNFTATPGLTGTQATMATAMDGACNALAATPGGNPGQADLFATCNTLGGADQATLQDDLDILAPDEIATLGTASVEVFNAQIANVVQRLAVVRGGGVGGTGLASFDYDPGDWMLAATSTEGLALGDSDGDADDSQRLGVFVNGSTGSSDRDAGTSEPGFEFDTHAVTAGLDYHFLDNLVLGAAASKQEAIARMSPRRKARNSKFIAFITHTPSTIQTSPPSRPKSPSTASWARPRLRPG